MVLFQIYDLNNAGNTAVFQLLLNSVCTAPLHSTQTTPVSHPLVHKGKDKIWQMSQSNQRDIPVHTMSCSAIKKGQEGA